MRWPVNLLPLVIGLELRLRRRGRGSRQEVSRSLDGEASGPESLTLLLRLSRRTFTGSTRWKATLSSTLLECVTACHFLISVGSFA